jgi:hypothetical protein
MPRVSLDKRLNPLALVTDKSDAFCQQFNLADNNQKLLWQWLPHKQQWQVLVLLVCYNT